MTGAARLVVLATLVGAGSFIVNGGINLTRDWSVKTLTEARATLHVAPHGRSYNDGTESSPLDLATALSKSSPARPGDTIWIHGGTYRGNYLSDLDGTEDAPIIVRQYPGERAVLDGTSSSEPVLRVGGSHTWFWGLEIMSSGTKRQSSSAADPRDLDRSPGVVNFGPDCKFINMIVHDLTLGFAVWGRSAPRSELYGNIVYYNGWELKGRGSGYSHGIYTQSSPGAYRVLRDNIVFSNYQQGIHIYETVDSEMLDNVTLEGNVSFVNGQLKARVGYNDNIHAGAYDQSSSQLRNMVCRSNYTYFPAEAGTGRGLNLGGVRGGWGEVSGNYIAGGGEGALYFANERFTARPFSNNVVWGPIRPRPPEGPDNTIHGLVKPKVNAVFVRPNVYERGRAHVIVYNWELRPQVRVDLATSGLSDGEPYEIRDSWNYFGDPIVRGVYTGAPVEIPMEDLRAAVPKGADVSRPPRHTAPEFGAFVVVPTARPAHEPN